MPRPLLGTANHLCLCSLEGLWINIVAHQLLATGVMPTGSNLTVDGLRLTFVFNFSPSFLCFLQFFVFLSPHGGNLTLNHFIQSVIWYFPGLQVTNLLVFSAALLVVLPLHRKCPGAT